MTVETTYGGILPANAYGVVGDIDAIARDIQRELRTHGGGEFKIELAAGGILDLEVIADGGKGNGSIAKVCADGTQAWTVRARWPNGDTMCEAVHPRTFVRILPKFLRTATTPRPVVTL